MEASWFVLDPLEITWSRLDISMHAECRYLLQQAPESYD